MLSGKDSEPDRAVDTANAADAPTKLSHLLPGQSRPFVHRFQTASNHYLLDVNTNRVLRVDAATWEIVEDVGVLSKVQLQQKHKDRYTPAEIAHAYEAILHAQENGRLLLPMPAKLSPPPGSAVVQEALESHRQKITLCVTEDCNFRCNCCVYGGGYRLWGTHSERRMEWEVAKLAMDDYLAHSYNIPKSQRCIAFYGGEPLLNFDLIKQCIAYVRNAVGDEMAFEVTTNGSLLEGDIADYLAAEEVSLLVSLNGPAHIHDYHRVDVDGHGTWEAVTRNIREFTHQHPEYSMVWGRRPFFVLETMLAPLLSAIDVEHFFSEEASRILGCTPSVLFSEMRSTESTYVESLAPGDRRIPGLKTLYRRFLESVASGAIARQPDDPRWMAQRLLFDKPFWRFLGRTIASRDTPILNGAARFETMCAPGCSNCMVSVEGEYFPCVRFPTIKDFCIGTIHDGVDPARSYGLRHGFFTLCEEECSHCWCVNICYAGCCSQARDGVVVSAEAKLRMCERFRKDTDEMLTDLFAVLERNPHAFRYLEPQPQNHE